jgi:hypothetical protein
LIQKLTAKIAEIAKRKQSKNAQLIFVFFAFFVVELKIERKSSHAEARRRGENQDRTRHFYAPGFIRAIRVIRGELVLIWRFLCASGASVKPVTSSELKGVHHGMIRQPCSQPGVCTE